MCLSLVLRRIRVPPLKDVPSTMDNNSQLCKNCDKIVKCLEQLRNQRAELNMLIEKQEKEKQNLLVEIEKYKYKIQTISKSLSQKIEARTRYDKAIAEAEEIYQNLLASSNSLIGDICKNVDELAYSNDKKIGTDPSDKNIA